MEQCQSWGCLGLGAPTGAAHGRWVMRGTAPPPTCLELGGNGYIFNESLSSTTNGRMSIHVRGKFRHGDRAGAEGDNFHRAGKRVGLQAAGAGPAPVPQHPLGSSWGPCPALGRAILPRR